MLDQSYKHVSCLKAATWDFIVDHFQVYLPLVQSKDKVSQLAFETFHSARLQYTGHKVRREFSGKDNPWVVTGQHPTHFPEALFVGLGELQIQTLRFGVTCTSSHR